MQLNEIFGFGKKVDPQQKLIKQIRDEIKLQRSYLHLAHSRQGFMDKHNYMDMVVKHFVQLYHRVESGEDVTSELQDLKKELKGARGFW